jgi:hypothetical protein
VVLAVAVTFALVAAIRVRRCTVGPDGRAALAVALATMALVWITVALGFAPPLFPYLFAPSVGALASVSALVALALAPVVPNASPSGLVWVARVRCSSRSAVSRSRGVGGWSEMQPIATAPLQQQIDAAVRAAVYPDQPYTIAAGGLVESVAHGEVALAVQQAGGRPRSDIFSLGLSPSNPSDPILVAAMGAPLACLLTDPVAAAPLVLAPSSASGLDVGVFLFGERTEREMAQLCLAR